MILQSSPFRRISFAIAMLGMFATKPTPYVGGVQEQTPKLVVVLSVDQMRSDYLSRFGPLLTESFGRLMQEGSLFTEAYHDHGITSTAPGHATISTGVFPRRNGIVSNDWWDREQHRPVYAVEDPSVEILASSESPGDLR